MIKKSKGTSGSSIDISSRKGTTKDSDYESYRQNKSGTTAQKTNVQTDMDKEEHAKRAYVPGPTELKKKKAEAQSKSRAGAKQAAMGKGGNYAAIVKEKKSDSYGSTTPAEDIGYRTNMYKGMSQSEKNWWNEHERSTPADTDHSALFYEKAKGRQK